MRTVCVSPIYDVVAADARPLDDGEREAWSALGHAIVHVRREVDDPLEHATGLTQVDFVVLDHLARAEQHRARMVELATVAAVSSSKLAYRIDRLIGLGLVTRESDCAEDARGTCAVLTPAGVAAHGEASTLRAGLVRSAFVSRLTPTQLQTLRRWMVAG